MGSSNARGAKRLKGPKKPDEAARLEKAIAEGAPAAGTTVPSAEASVETTGYAAAREFDELPISRALKAGLAGASYVTMTAIQRAALPHALAGRDVLGAAKTGSGKTLAFVIPLIELLFRKHWSSFDGLGALIISPTRELAMQIFEELMKVGKHHDLSAGLLIGGKNVKEEQERIDQMNILVATPGRLLQHMDETYGFNAANLQILVLDEADRILDMGFQGPMSAILENLPKHRQTLLFSATQTKSVKDLACLSLSNPEFLAVHSEATTATPVKLQQSVITCKLGDKITVLWSFIKSHLKIKTLVFVSTCKQVRFIYEAFRKLRPGVSVRALHGHMKQQKRMEVFYEFCQATSMVLFATDIASRGLDFPEVDWVVQMDAPEDQSAYLHRVGRTARYVAGGHALLLLLPSEKAIVALLEGSNIPLKPLKLRQSRLQSPTSALQALLSKNLDLKSCAQAALVAYVKSVALQPLKSVFNVEKLHVEELAESFGLSTMPSSRALKKLLKRTTKGKRKINRAEEVGTVFNDNAPVEGLAAENGLHRSSKKGTGADADDFLVIKRKDALDANGLADASEEVVQLPADRVLVNARKGRLKIDKNRRTGNRLVFDEDGQLMNPLEALGKKSLEGKVTPREDGSGHKGLDMGEFDNPESRFEALAAGLKERAKEDRKAARLLRRERQLKQKEKKKLKEVKDSEKLVTIGGLEDSGEGGDERGDEVDANGYVERSENESGDGALEVNSEGDEMDATSEGTGCGDDQVEDSDSYGGESSDGGICGRVAQQTRGDGRGGFALTRGKMKQQKGKQSDIEGMCIEEQEALALRLISKNR